MKSSQMGRRRKPRVSSWHCSKDNTKSRSLTPWKVDWNRVHAVGILILYTLFLLQPVGDGGQNRLHIGFLVEGDTVDPGDLNIILRNWSDAFFSRYAIEAILDVQRLDTTLPFQSNLQVHNSFQSHNISVVVPDKCDTLVFLSGAALANPDPVFTLAPFSCLEESLASVHGFPSQFSLCTAAIREVLLDLKWQNVIMFYDDMYGPGFTSIMWSIPEVRFRPVSLTGLNESQILQAIAQAQESMQVCHYFVICRSSCLEMVFKQVAKLEKHMGKQGLVSFHSRWLVVGKKQDMSIIAPLLEKIPHVAMIYAKEETAELMSTQFISSNLATLGGDIMEYFTNGTLSQTTCFQNMAGQQYCDSFHLVPHSSLSVPLFEVASATSMLSNNSRVFQVTAQWSEGNRLRRSGEIFPLAGYGFNRLPLRVALQEKKLFVEPDDEQGTYKGFCVEMLEHLAAILNFTYLIVNVDDHDGDGMLLADGHWTGVVGMLIDQEVDMVVSPFAITDGREKVIDFSYPYYMDYYTVLYKRIDPATMKWRLFVEPFKWPVWLCISVAVPFTGLAMCIISRLSAFYSEEEKKLGLGDLKYCLFFAFGSLVQQSGVHEPKSLSGRFVVGFWWFFCVAIVATYTGNLIAFLTVSIEFLPFTSLSGMLESGIDYGFQSGTVFHTLLVESAESDLEPYQSMFEDISQDLSQKPHLNITSPNPDVHIQKVLSGDYAFIGDKTTLSLAEREYCGDLELLHERITSVQYGLGFPNGSTLTSVFSGVILQFHENGFFDTWKQRYWNEKSVCSNAMSIANPVTATDMQGPIYVFFVAVFICFISLIGELLYHRHKSRKKVVPRTKLVSMQLSEDEVYDKKLHGSMQSGLNQPPSYIERSDTARTTLSSDSGTDMVSPPVDS